MSGEIMPRARLLKQDDDAAHEGERTEAKALGGSAEADFDALSARGEQAAEERACTTVPGCGRVRAGEEGGDDVVGHAPWANE